MTRPKVSVLFGPTATGKTALAVERALTFGKNNAAIVNADAMQCYAGLPILSAQPNMADRKEIPHYLFSTLSMSDTLTAAHWAKLATEQIKICLAQGQHVFVVGGTGFYIRALTEGLSPIPATNPDLLCRLETQQTEQLYAQLQHIDPPIALVLKPADRQRILRALAVYEDTGKTLSAWQSLPTIKPDFDFDITIMDVDNINWLDTRIEQRVHAMVKNGAIDEVKAMRASNPPPNSKGLKAHGYKNFGNYLDGKLSLEEAIAATALESRQYAKRQRTWARTQIKADHLLKVG